MSDRFIVATTIMKSEKEKFKAEVKASGLTASEFIRHKLGYTVSTTRSPRGTRKK
jgi:hypothetical protein